MALDENDQICIKIEKRLHAVVAELDDDFLERVTNADWDENTQHSHWYNAVLQMMYCIVASYGVPVDEYFTDHGVEPHNVYLLPEYKRRMDAGVYPAKTYDGLNRNFNRGEYYGMHGMNKK